MAKKKTEYESITVAAPTKFDINELNEKIENNIKTVENVKETLEEIEDKTKPVQDVEHIQMPPEGVPSAGHESPDEVTLRVQKKIVKSNVFIQIGIA